MFLFPLRPGVERTGEQILEGGKTTQATQAMHKGVVRASCFVFLAPLSHLLSALPALHVQVDLSCLVCPALPVSAAANTPTLHTHRGSTAQLPAQLQICAPSHPGWRANAAPSSVDFAHRKQATTHSLPRPSLRSTPSQVTESALLPGQ